MRSLWAIGGAILDGKTNWAAFGIGFGALAVILLLQGYKNKDIAEALGNSEQVIKNYLRSIFDKTGVSDRLELALFAIHHKILVNQARVPATA